MGVEGGTLSLQHHPTGRMDERTPDWIVCAVPAQPVEWLYQQLRDAAPGLGIEVHRVGDCIAPRRAHAAVVEGERVGASL
jgi:2,4-dienoyl-CoA reductase (NADPH2)